MPASQKNKILAYFLVLATIGTFIVVALQTFEVRLETQEGYPVASSFRADARGCRALYESLHRVPGVQTARFLRTFSNLPPADGRSLVIAGVDPQINTLRVQDRKSLSAWAESGGTLIIALAVDDKNSGQAGSPDYELVVPQKEQSSPSPNLKSTPPSEEFWIETLQGAGVHVFRHVDSSARHHFVSRVFATLGSWLGPLYFRDLQSPWRVVAEADHLPVVIQRSLGRGNVILVADSYLLTNGSLATDRETGFLGWLFRKSSTVLFDESHFGFMENPGVVSLARRYGLESAFFVLLILALFFVWANRYSLVPKSASRSAESLIVPGKGGETVFLNLLRRSLPTKDLLSTCAELWRKGVHDAGKTRKLDQLLPTLDPRSSAVARYNQLSQRLNERT
jgi:Domain of unknown function (DUF4350)